MLIQLQCCSGSRVTGHLLDFPATLVQKWGKAKMQPKPAVFLETDRLSQSTSQSLGRAVRSSTLAGWLATGSGRNTLCGYIARFNPVQCILLIVSMARLQLGPVQLAPLGWAGGLGG